MMSEKLRNVAWVYYDYDNAFYRGPSDLPMASHVLSDDRKRWLDYKSDDKIAPHFFGDVIANPAPDAI